MHESFYWTCFKTTIGILLMVRSKIRGCKSNYNSNGGNYLLFLYLPGLLCSFMFDVCHVYHIVGCVQVSLSQDVELQSATMPCIKLLSQDNKELDRYCRLSELFLQPNYVVSAFFRNKYNQNILILIYQPCSHLHLICTANKIPNKYKI